jgi:hypothetical protein
MQTHTHTHTHTHPHTHTHTHTHPHTHTHTYAHTRACTCSRPDNLPACVVEDRPQALNRLALPTAAAGPGSGVSSRAHSPVGSDRTAIDLTSPSPSPHPPPQPSIESSTSVGLDAAGPAPTVSVTSSRGRGLSAPDTIAFTGHLVPADTRPEVMRELLQRSQHGRAPAPRSDLPAAGSGSEVVGDLPRRLARVSGEPAGPLYSGFEAGPAGNNPSRLQAPMVVIRESSYPTAPVQLVNFHLQPTQFHLQPNEFQAVTSMLIDSGTPLSVPLSAPPTGFNAAALDEISFDLPMRHIASTKAGAAMCAGDAGGAPDGGRAKSPRNEEEDDESGMQKRASLSRSSRRSSIQPPSPPSRRGSRPGTPRSRETSPGRRSRETSPGASLSRKSSVASLTLPLPSGPRKSDPTDMPRAAARCSEDFTSMQTQPMAYPLIQRHYSDAALLPGARAAGWYPRSLIGHSAAHVAPSRNQQMAFNVPDPDGFAAAAHSEGLHGLPFDTSPLVAGPDGGGGGSGSGSGGCDGVGGLAPGGVPARQMSAQSNFSETDLSMYHMLSSSAPVLGPPFGAFAETSMVPELHPAAAFTPFMDAIAPIAPTDWPADFSSLIDSGLLNAQAAAAAAVMHASFASGEGRLAPPASDGFARTTSTDPDGSVVHGLSAMAFSPTPTAVRSTCGPGAALAHPPFNLSMTTGSGPGATPAQPPFNLPAASSAGPVDPEPWPDAGTMITTSDLPLPGRSAAATPTNERPGSSGPPSREQH